MIAGTATVVSGKVAGRQAAAAAPPPAAAAAEPVAAAAVAPEPAAPTGLTDEAMGQLKKLAELRSAGVLTDEEFDIQKARILN